MKSLALVLCLAASAVLAAQTAPKPVAPAAKSSAATKSTTATAHTATTTGYKLPAGVKRVPGIPKLVMKDWHYQDILVGKGPEGEPGKLWHMKYTGWRAADGVIFDTWENNKRPEMKDGKPVMGPDGKPVMGDPQPLAFPQGQGRLIPGFDWAIEGMHVGGKRRIFIPWQLAYGVRVIPDRPEHPGIPPKSDLIFDVELVDVTDVPTPPQRPMMPQRPMPRPGAPGTPGAPPNPGSTAPAGQPATPPPSTAPAPGAPPKPANTTPPPQTQPSTPPQPK